MINKSRLVDLSLILFISYGMFYNLLTCTILENHIILAAFWLFVLLLSFIGCNDLRSVKIEKNHSIAIITLFIFAFIFIRNQEIANGSAVMTLRWIFYLLYALSIYKNGICVPKIVKYICIIGFIHVIATWFFFFFKSTYAYMYHIWQYWPSGTGLGSYGYRAGLTNHYSANGTVLAITYISFFSLMFGNGEKILSRKNRKYLICFLLAFSACVLTCKRAHVLFGSMSMLFVFYIYNKEKMTNRFFKIFFAVALLSCLVILASPYIPVLNDFLDRFDSLEDDSTMGSRYVFWIYALKMFLSNPVFGNGWLSFRYQYRLNLYDTSVRAARYEYLNAHNVYVQLLAEVGIVGFIFFIIIGFTILFSSIKLLRKYRIDLLKTGKEISLIFSLTFQVFFLLYSLTGNCLYDSTASFYFLSIAIVLHVNNIVRKGNMFA